MLKCLQVDFRPNPSCIKGIDKNYFTCKAVSCFDNDGFELSLLEQQYYKENTFPLFDFLNHTCFQVKWFTLDDEHFILDHSLILERKDFQGEAREEIFRHSKRFPQLLKYLKLKPKWGIDFSLEYYKGNEYIEVLHIEYDYYEYEEAVKSKDEFQTKLLSTDWNDFLLTLKKKKEEWVNLKGFQQNDYKARLWGLPKAEDTLKSFA